MIASAMAISFSSSVIAGDLHSHQGELKTIYKGSASTSVLKLDTQNKNHVVNQATKSGMRNHFDQDLNQATFVWSSKNQRKPDLQLVAPENRAAYAADFYLNSLTTANVNATSGLTTELKYVNDKNGPIIAKYKQSVHGVEVFNKEYNILMDKEYNLVAGSGYLANPIPAKNVLSLMSGFGSVEAAVQKAFTDLSRGDLTVELGAATTKGQYKEYKITATGDKYQVIGDARVKRVFFEVRGKQQAAYYIEAQIAEKDSLDSTYFNYVVNATDGDILMRNDLRSHAGNDFTYRVFAHQSGFPFDGPHGDDQIPKLSQDTPDKSDLVDMPLVTLSHYSAISTQDPWLAEDATMTVGNNVVAYADVLAPQGYNEGDIVAEVTSDKTFDYVLSQDESANSLNNRKAAVVNMFYFNNFMHDFYYDYGFDEVSGNAQLSNYERGGVEGDPLEAQAQDSSGYNNANMSTPADGASPRMQQYLYNDKDAVNGEDWGLTVTSHEDIGLMSSSRLASFGPVQYSGVTAEVVRLVDGNNTDSGSVNDGCEAATNGADLDGKIAIIDRGSCNFTAKVKHAQDAGAIAAIIVNNTDDGTPAPMGGEDATVTIPSMGLNFAEGKEIYDLVDADVEVNVEMFSTFPLKDSSFDNGIIAHEWGHYIQNRLVGNASGLVNFQGRAMGEGWADVHSLIFLVKDSDRDLEGNSEFMTPYATGTYVEDFYFGIRRVPYTPNMEINPLTFKHIASGAIPGEGIAPTNTGSPHAPGEIWATVLWDVYVGLLQNYEFAEAEKRFVTYMVNGYKMTPIAPTYTEARDAILAVIYANDMTDYTRALDAFARRGLGLDAVSPPRTSTNLTEVQEGFSKTLAAYDASEFTLNADYDGVSAGYCSADGVLDKGETGTVSLNVTNKGNQTLTNVKVQLAVTSDHDVTLENDGMVTIAEIAPYQTVSTGAVMITLNDANPADTLTIEATFPEVAEDDDIQEPGSISISPTVNFSFDMKENTDNTLSNDMETLSMFKDFSEVVMRGGDAAVGTQVIDTINTGFFQGFNPGVNLGSQTMLLINNGFESDVAIETDYMQVGYEADFALDFWHFFYIENTWDGGVIEISINDAPWVDVTEAGGTFDVGYTAELREQDAQALGGRMTFTGINGDFATAMGNMERLSFGDSLNGQTVKLRFRIATDSVASDFGWFIDNVHISNVVNKVFSEVVTGETASCDNSAPKVTVAMPDAVLETATGSIMATATDRNDDDLTYTWSQTEGAMATITTGDSATLSFTPPAIEADTELTFMVTVSDGMDSVSETVKVAITNVDPAPEPEPESEDDDDDGFLGLSLGWGSLILLPFAWYRRRKQKA